MYFRKLLFVSFCIQQDKLIAKYGYPAEVHHVTTEDGYILTMHRIRKVGAQPFLLQHGLVDSSAGYVIMGPNISLGKFSFHCYLFYIQHVRINEFFQRSL